MALLGEDHPVAVAIRVSLAIHAETPRLQTRPKPTLTDHLGRRVRPQSAAAPAPAKGRSGGVVPRLTPPPTTNTSETRPPTPSLREMEGWTPRKKKAGKPIVKTIPYHLSFRTSLMEQAHARAREAAEEMRSDKVRRWAEEDALRKERWEERVRKAEMEAWEAEQLRLRFEWAAPEVTRDHPFLTNAEWARQFVSERHGKHKEVGARARRRWRRVGRRLINHSFAKEERERARELELAAEAAVVELRRMSEMKVAYAAEQVSVAMEERERAEGEAAVRMQAVQRGQAAKAEARRRREEAREVIRARKAAERRRRRRRYEYSRHRGVRRGGTSSGRGRGR